ncbi:MAG: hypothetical protein WAZ34_17460 [Rhodocyclaceae bacterium]
MNSSKGRHFDVFNGDADGLCALQQLRLAEPREASLICGAKREHALLERVPAQRGDSVTVLDLPLAANCRALQGLLGQGVGVDYFDHHHLPEALAQAPHPLLRLTIDPAPDVCTSILVNRHLEGRFRAWAVVGAFGDNLPASAQRLAASLDLSEANVLLLKALGECLNYNAYGDSEADLTILPADLYRQMAGYADPLEFMENEAAYVTLAPRRAEDMRLAVDVTPMLESGNLVVTLLPDAAWSRRVIGSYANRQCGEHPERTCIVLAPNARQSLTVSLRAAQGAAVTASQLARRHGGDGRETAAGINNMRPVDVPGFILNVQTMLGATAA